MASPSASRAVSPSPSQLPPVPTSPIYSIASTANPISALDLPLPPAPRHPHAVLTKNDLARSQEAYSELVTSAKQYRLALAALSTAASTFGSALESCARLKEARADPIGPPGATSMSASFTTKGANTADTLMSASGVHHLIANHQQILSETVYRSFEVPLLHDLDKWQGVIDDEEETYKQKIKVQTKEIKRLEKEGLKLHKQRRRDVARFRAHLVNLTSKLDGLTTTHSDHSRALLRESQETSGRIVEASCSLVRAEVDIFESLARKGWSGGGLEDLLERGQDLFATEHGGAHAGGNGPHGGGENAKLFSILPPKSILATSGSDNARPGPGGHARSDSLLVDAERYQSLTAVASDLRGEGDHYPDQDAESITSGDFNRPRGARPFSPQPIRRIPAGLTEDELDIMGGFGESHSGQPTSRSPHDGDKDDGTGQGDDGELINRDEIPQETSGGQGPRSESGRQSPTGRHSPEFITDESSPDGS